MARKDVVNEYLAIEEQYNEMVNMAKDYDEALAGQYITQEQYEDAQELIRNLQENYDRWSYVIFLLNMPVKKNKKVKYKKENSKLIEDFNSLKATTQDSLDEGRVCLKNFKEYLEGLKEKKDD